jgi:hypothetical protein
MENSRGMGHAHQHGLSKNCQLYVSAKWDYCDGTGGYQEHTHPGTYFVYEREETNLFTKKLLENY